MRKVFISYNSSRDQSYKEKLVKLDKENNIFSDTTLNTKDVGDDFNDYTVKNKLRDEYIKDSEVLIVLIGKCTMHRKHIDWEIASAMYSSGKKKKLAIIGIILPGSSYNNTPKRMYTGRQLGSNVIPILNWKDLNSNSLSKAIEVAYEAKNRNRFEDASFVLSRSNKACE